MAARRILVAMSVARLAFGLSFLALLPGAAPAFAAPGKLSTTWGEACTPIVQDATASTTSLRLVFSVLGNDDTHNAYQVRFVLSDVNRRVPDAWEFELDGCQGSSFLTIAELPAGALSKTCPSFAQEAPLFAIKNYSAVPPDWGLATTQRRGVLVVSYGKGVTSDPGTRYFLGEFRFDHLQSVEGPGVPAVTCGGLERPMCLWVLSGTSALTGGSTYFREEDGSEIPFEFDPGANFVTVNGMLGCPGVPASPTTWGALKNVYRR